MSKNTKKKSYNQIAIGGDYASAALGLSIWGEEVQSSFIDICIKQDCTRLKEKEIATNLGIPSTGNFVYFVQELSPNKWIKIGYSKHLATRIRSMNTCNPYGVLVLGYTPGSLESERCFHEMFSEYHFRGEWFYYSEAIVRYVVSLVK